MMLPSPIMMVCAGNMCRSPFAEYYMRMKLEQAGVAGACFSRGLLAMPGRKAPDLAKQIAREFGVEMQTHISQTMLAPDVDRAALIMVMEPAQRQHLSKMRPASIGKVFLLSQPLGGAAIADPMGSDADFFRKVYQEISHAIDAWGERFGIPQ
ncbi:MAG: hypothetical protein Q9M20_07515 [Mariprofundaceae bacterium]|nr:hypothetical protein [Mariprofundaceae bacterium]